MLEKALESLYASGPLAIVLSVAIVKLWQKVSELSEKLTKQVAANVEREDRMRAEHQERVDRLHGDQVKLLRELNDTLKDLAGEE